MDNVLILLEDYSKLLYLSREPGVNLIVIFEEFIFAVGKRYCA